MHGEVSLSQLTPVSAVKTDLPDICWNDIPKELKPLQNKKGQKNLGYPKKKQSFS